MENLFNHLTGCKPDQKQCPVKVNSIAKQVLANGRFKGAEEHALSVKKQCSKIKSLSYLPYYTKVCNELQGPSPQLSAWATQLRGNVATVASRWHHCADLTGLGIEPRTPRTNSVHLATELTAGQQCSMLWKKPGVDGHLSTPFTSQELSTAIKQIKKRESSRP